MAQSNCDALILHLIVELLAEEHNPQGKLGPLEGEHFISSSWYADIIFMLQHLQSPQVMDKTMAILLNNKASTFSILEGKLYWKDIGGVLLNCVDEHEASIVIKEFHAGECGGNH